MLLYLAAQVEKKCVFIDGQLALTTLAKSISSTLFSSTAATRELIQSYKYVGSIEGFQQQLLAWREAYLDNRGQCSMALGRVGIPQYSYLQGKLIHVHCRSHIYYFVDSGFASTAAIYHIFDMFYKGN